MLGFPRVAYGVMTQIMRSNVKKNKATPTSSAVKTAAYVAGAVVLLLIFVWLQNSATTSPSDSGSFSTKTMPTQGASNAEVVEGESQTTPQIPYNFCGNPSNPHIVLLHGARFTKRDWETSGIMQKLCSRGVSVSALNLPVRAGHAQLLQVIEALALERSISLPVAAVVSPSASGFTIVDGIVSGNIGALKAKIRSWIPVASPASLQHDVSDLTPANGWPILAVYGNQDPMGPKTSKVWADAANAKVVELQVSNEHLARLTTSCWPLCLVYYRPTHPHIRHTDIQ